MLDARLIAIVGLSDDPNRTSNHVGGYLQDAGYRTIQQLLLSHDYRPGSQPFIFFRTVRVGSRDIEMEVDLLGIRDPIATTGVEEMTGTTDDPKVPYILCE